MKCITTTITNYIDTLTESGAKKKNDTTFLEQQEAYATLCKS